MLASKCGKDPKSREVQDIFILKMHQKKIMYLIISTAREQQMVPDFVGDKYKKIYK